MACLDIVARRKYDKKYYQNNKEIIKARAIRWNQFNKEIIKKYRNIAFKKKYYVIRKWYYDNIMTLNCPICGISFLGRACIADFHHTDSNTKSNGKRGMIGFVTIKSYNTVVKELNKGIFMCANCHRIEHNTEP